MSEKLLFLKNVLGQVEELTNKQKELQQAKDQINLTGNVELRGEMTVGNLTISLNELTKDVPSTISSNLKMVLSQYVDHLIQKNGQLQQDLLSNIQIAHMQDTATSGTSGESLSPYSDEKKNYSELHFQPLVPSVETKKEISPSIVEEKVEEKVEEIETIHAPQQEIVKEVPKVVKEVVEEPKVIFSLPTNEELQSRLDQATYAEKLRKIIAEEFYSYDKHQYIHPQDVQSKITEKVGREVTIEEINDVAWALIAQDVISFVYRARCEEGHEEYLSAPLPKRISCHSCHKDITDVDISYQKLV